jgi:uncharacterized OB-fold protein
MTRPMPEPTELTQAFWDAARRHELVAQRCSECSAWRHYPQLRCPTCLSGAWEWAPLSGRGTVHTFTITHQAFHAHWQNRVPYAIAIVELDEGIRMVSDVPSEELEDLHIGALVEVVFEQISDEITLPRFRIADRE